MFIYIMTIYTVYILIKITIMYIYICTHIMNIYVYILFMYIYICIYYDCTYVYIYISYLYHIYIIYIYIIYIYTQMISHEQIMTHHRKTHYSWWNLRCCSCSTAQCGATIFWTLLALPVLGRQQQGFLGRRQNGDCRRPTGRRLMVNSMVYEQVYKFHI